MARSGPVYLTLLRRRGGRPWLPSLLSLPSLAGRRSLRARLDPATVAQVGSETAAGQPALRCRVVAQVGVQEGGGDGLQAVLHGRIAARSGGGAGAAASGGLAAARGALIAAGGAGDAASGASGGAGAARAAIRGA